MQLLDVMHRVSSTPPLSASVSSSARGAGASIRYFALCRALGVRAVDDMVRARVLELRWAEPVTPEGGGFSRVVGVPAALGADAVGVDGDGYGEAGPTLLPTTPIMAYAMRAVLAEYEYQPADEEGEEVIDDADSGAGSTLGVGRGYRDRRESSGMSDDKSDYMSLSDVSEY